MREIAACLSLASLLLGSYLLNCTVFPAVAVAFPLGREISTCCGAAMALAVAFVAFRSPHLVREGLWSGACLAAFGASLAMLAWGVVSGNTLLIALGSPFGGAGQVWFSVLAGIAFARLGFARSTVCVPSGFAVAYLVQALLEVSGTRLGYGFGILLYFLCTTVSYLLIRTPVREQLAIIREAHAPAVLDTTNPQSFLPLGSKVFVAVGLFNAALGYAFGSGAAATDTAFLLASFVPMLGLFFVMAVGRRTFSPDAIYLLATALVIAGLLLAPFRFLPASFLPDQTPALFLQSGFDCFSLLTYLLVASLGARNPIGSLSVSASVCAASHFGIACGAVAAQGADAIAGSSLDGTSWSLLFLTALVFAFTLFNLIAMKGFSFQRLANGLRPVPLSLAMDEPPAHSALPVDAPSDRFAANVFSAGSTPRPGTASPTTQPDTPSNSTASATAANLGVATDAPAFSAPEASLDERCTVVANRYQLTPREVEVLALLARGRTSPIIQEKLVVSQNTVRTHVRHIYAKLDVHSQQELINLVDAAR